MRRPPLRKQTPHVCRHNKARSSPGHKRVDVPSSECSMGNQARQLPTLESIECPLIDHVCRQRGTVRGISVSAWNSWAAREAQNLRPACWFIKNLVSDGRKWKNGVGGLLCASRSFDSISSVSGLNGGLKPAGQRLKGALMVLLQFPLGDRESNHASFLQRE